MDRLTDLENRYDGPIPTEELAKLAPAGHFRDDLIGMPRDERLSHDARTAEADAALAWSSMRRLCRRHDRFHIGLIQAHRMHIETGSVFGRREWLRLRQELAGYLAQYHGAKERVAVAYRALSIRLAA